MFIKKLRESRLFKTASIYTATNIINALIPFFLMPILTRYLTPADYGITAMMQVMIGFLMPVISINLAGAIAVKYYKQDAFDFGKYVSNCIYIMAFATSIIAILLQVFKNEVAFLTSFPAEWLFLIPIICLGQALISMVLVVLQHSHKVKIYSSIQLSQSVCSLALALYFVVILGFDWQGRVIAQVITSVIFLFLGVYLFKKWRLIFQSFDISYIKDALSFGVPLIPHALSGFFVLMVDRFYITHLVGIEETGIYSVGAQIGMAINLLAGSFNQAYSPWLYRKLSNPTDEDKYKIVKFTYFYFALILLFAISYAIVMPIFLDKFLGDRFHAAGIYIMGIAVAGAFQGMYCMVVNYIFYTEKSAVLAKITFSTGVLHVINTYFFIEHFGAIGATYSSALTAFVTFVLVWKLSMSVYSMPWKVGKAR